MIFVHLDSSGELLSELVLDVAFLLELSQRIPANTVKVRKFPQIYSSIHGLYITIVWLSPDRMGRLCKPPASLALLPSRTSSHMRCAVALHPSIANASMKQYECGRTQLFIVIEASET